jgi:CRP/FNR family transcriptional regulator, cyclic AMP receptor protein
MADEQAGAQVFAEQLKTIECLGSANQFAEAVFGLVGRSQFFADFTREDTTLLSEYMTIYRAKSRQTIISEGDLGDYMLMIIQGEVDIYKKNLLGESQLLATAGQGMTIGEMSMIDGEPRFATCVAARETLFGVLSREAMVKIILEKPSLGAKILIKLVTMLSNRLRQTSSKLLQYMRAK